MFRSFFYQFAFLGVNMNHDELLARIDEDEKFLEQYFGGKFKGQSALRAVVKLHKPYVDHFTYCNDCERIYPCPTIQTIEEELG